MNSIYCTKGNCVAGKLSISLCSHSWCNETEGLFKRSGICKQRVTKTSEALIPTQHLYISFCSDATRLVTLCPNVTHVMKTVFPKPSIVLYPDREMKILVKKRNCLQRLVAIHGALAQIRRFHLLEHPTFVLVCQ
jgi:hypothetical protein